MPRTPKRKKDEVDDDDDQAAATPPPSTPAVRTTRSGRKIATPGTDASRRSAAAKRQKAAAAAEADAATKATAGTVVVRPGQPVPYRSPGKAQKRKTPTRSSPRRASAAARASAASAATNERGNDDDDDNSSTGSGSSPEGPPAKKRRRYEAGAVAPGQPVPYKSPASSADKKPKAKSPKKKTAAAAAAAATAGAVAVAVPGQPTPYKSPARRKSSSSPKNNPMGSPTPTSRRSPATSGGSNNNNNDNNASPEETRAAVQAAVAATTNGAGFSMGAAPSSRSTKTTPGRNGKKRATAATARRQQQQQRKQPPPPSIADLNPPMEEEKKSDAADDDAAAAFVPGGGGGGSFADLAASAPETNTWQFRANQLLFQIREDGIFANALSQRLGLNGGVAGNDGKQNDGEQNDAQASDTIQQRPPRAFEENPVVAPQPPDPLQQQPQPQQDADEEEDFEEEEYEDIADNVLRRSFALVRKNAPRLFWISVCALLVVCLYNSRGCIYDGIESVTRWGTDTTASIYGGAVTVARKVLKKKKMCYKDSAIPSREDAQVSLIATAGDTDNPCTEFGDDLLVWVPCPDDAVCVDGVVVGCQPFYEPYWSLKPGKAYPKTPCALSQKSKKTLEDTGSLLESWIIDSKCGCEDGRTIPPALTRKCDFIEDPGIEIDDLYFDYARLLDYAHLQLGPDSKGLFTDMPEFVLIECGSSNGTTPASGATLIGLHQPPSLPFNCSFRRTVQFAINSLTSLIWQLSVGTLTACLASLWGLFRRYPVFSTVVPFIMLVFSWLSAVRWRNNKLTEDVHETARDVLDYLQNVHTSEHKVLSVRDHFRHQLVDRRAKKRFVKEVWPHVEKKVSRDHRVQHYNRAGCWYWKWDSPVVPHVAPPVPRN